MVSITRPKNSKKEEHIIIPDVSQPKLHSNQNNFTELTLLLPDLIRCRSYSLMCPVKAVTKNHRAISIVPRQMRTMQLKKLQSHRPNQGHGSPISHTFFTFASGQRVGWSPSNWNSARFSFYFPRCLAFTSTHEPNRRAKMKSVHTVCSMRIVKASMVHSQPNSSNGKYDMARRAYIKYVVHLLPW